MTGSPISPSRCRGWARGRSACSAPRRRSRPICRLVASGEKIAAFALTEPTSGSDVASMETRADPDGDGYVVNGAKTYISNGGIADFYVLFARTGEAPGAKGVSAFIVEARHAGPGRQRADRGDRAAPARDPQLHRHAPSRRRPARRARPRLRAGDGDARRVPHHRRRGGSGLRPPRARRGDDARPHPPVDGRDARRQCGGPVDARRDGAGRRGLGPARLPRRLAARRDRAGATAARRRSPSSTPPTARRR